MPLPAIPKDYTLINSKNELDAQNVKRTIDNIAIFLQRLRDSLGDEILSILEDNPELIIAIIFSVFRDSDTITFDTIDERIIADIITHSVVFNRLQQISGETLLGNSSSLLNEVEEIQLGSSLSFSGNTLNVTLPLGTSRVVPLDTVYTILNTYSLIVQGYYLILGILALEGDASLTIL